MEIRRSLLALLLVFVISHPLQTSTAVQKKSYIVYLGGHPEIPEDASLIEVEDQRKDAHYELLGTVLGSKEKAEDAIFYSYTKNINGFAAVMEEDEAKEISKKPGVLSVIPNKLYKLHTTHTWDFLGLEKNENIHSWSLWKKARFGEDTIIATIDSGVWPEHQSFNDRGMGPIPSRWKGSCEKGFPCNRKLIGARHFSKGFKKEGTYIDPKTENPRDTEGHGTHTLSTAAGRFVANASFLNNARGTAKGGSPNARVAAYKACWPGRQQTDCASSDILAAIEAAIHDGVDVISMSIGGDVHDYFLDTTAIGAFHAIKKGIPVVCSAGNEGPKPGTVKNVAPWIFTVAASTHDRVFHTYLSLGNKKRIQGTSFSDSGLAAFKPIVRGEDVKVYNASEDAARDCLPGSLDPKKANGKIVVCITSITTLYLDLVKGKTVRDAGGAGMVLACDETVKVEVFPETHVLPAIQIAYSDGLAVLSYLNSTKTPTGLITLPQSEFGVMEAPEVGAFSSRGPSPLHPEILKPDITAPGLRILGAFPPGIYKPDLPSDKRDVAFNFLTGTSMSCPHVAGIVGLFKTLYPDWSPAAIKSALMTSAKTLDNKGVPIRDLRSSEATTPFSYGSGHVHPEAAMYPGLVYDMTETDYLDFLCSIGYDASRLATFNEKPYSCPKKAMDIKDLNYPLIAVASLSGSITVQRTVKNVGAPGTYHARVTSPQGVSVYVKPDSLEFKIRGEEKKFVVTLTAKEQNKSGGDYVFGSLIWEDGKHSVRSQIAVKVAS